MYGLTQFKGVIETMKKVIMTREQLSFIDLEITGVHLGFRPAEQDIFTMLNNYPNLRTLQVPKAYYLTISNTTKTVLARNNIKLTEGSVRDAIQYLGD